MSKISPCLWFDSQAEEAAIFYVETFRACGQDAALGRTSHRPGGTVLVAEFTLAGQSFLGLNGGPLFNFSPAVSLSVKCADQAELDNFWEAFCDGDAPGRCGWLTDKFGVSWQIVPDMLGDMTTDHDPARAQRVTEACMPMSKLEIAVIKRAYDGD
jgi:predicted 3-demethylubiquinone-9 3-methyltransferase (glyoxalase superfamily)